MAFLDQDFELTCHFCGQDCIYADYDNDNVFEPESGPGLLAMEAPACPVQDMQGMEHIVPSPDTQALIELLPDGDSTHIYFTFSAFKSEGEKLFDAVFSMWYECPDFVGEKKDNKQVEEELKKYELKKHIDIGDDEATE